MIQIALALGLTILLHKGDVFGPPSRPQAAMWTQPSAGDGTPLPTSFSARDGATLRGWLFRAPEGQRPYLLFFYGSNEDIVVERKRLAYLATALDLNVVAFDYRGYGFSGAQIDPAAMRDDAVSAYDAASKMALTNPVIVYGWSVGAEFAIHVAAQRSVAGLILQAPPASAAEMAVASRKHDVPSFARWAITLRHDEETTAVFQGAREIKSSAAPLLILQGDADDVVPPDQAQEVLDASWAQEKRLVIVPGAHHNDLRISTPPAAPALRTFVGLVAAEGSAKD